MGKSVRPSGRARIAVVLLGILFVAAPAAPTGAANGSTACTFEHIVIASPGLSTSPSSGTFTSNGQTGTITCRGPVHGKQPNGAGKLGAEGRYGTKGPATCQSGGEGEGTHTITIPTSAGDEHITNRFMLSFGPFKAGGPFSGTFQGDWMSGTFEAEVIEGDCLSKPVTRFQVKGRGTVNG